MSAIGSHVGILLEMFFAFFFRVWLLHLLLTKINFIPIPAVDERRSIYCDRFLGFMARGSGEFYC